MLDSTPMPAPLTPPECNMHGLRYMPLDVDRLLNSDLFLRSTGDEFKAALTLWCRAFLQVPAGSVPNDERALAILSGSQNWAEVRERALSGFILCSDGRLYHPVVAEKALDAWEKRTAFRGRTSKATEARKQRHREREAAKNADAAKNDTVNAASIATPDVEGNVTSTPASVKKEERSREEKKKSQSTFLSLEAARVDAETREALRQPSALEDAIPSPTDPLNVGHIPGSKLDRDEGRLAVNGIFVDVFARECCEAAEMASTGADLRDWKTVGAWLNASLDPTDVLDVIRRLAKRRGYRSPFRLSFFDSIVRADVSPRNPENFR
jgi:Protein of unknown function (DUF1376)